MTASFSEAFLFLIKNSDGSVLHAVKGKPVSIDVSKLKSESEIFYFQMIFGNSMILLSFWEKNISENTKMR